jgi:hypothetical protein
MHIWAQLLVREGEMFVLLLCLGAGPAAFLNEHFDLAGRLALMPVLGFVVGTLVTTNVLQFEPADNTYWLLIPLTLGSLGLAAWRSGLFKGRRPQVGISLRDAAQLIVVVLAVAGPVNYALHHAGSTGPVAYVYTDVDTYVAEIDGAQHMSTQDASDAWVQHTRTGRQFPSFTEKFWAFIANYDDKLDAAPLEANVNALLGLDATQTDAPDLVVLLLLGGLGGFAALRYATRSRTWIAVLAGALFGGPLVLELFFDSYQAAIPGLAVLLPIAAVGHSAITRHRRADVVLLALLVACLLTVYPLFTPPLFATGALVLLVRAVRRRRAGESLRKIVRPELAGAAWFIALAVVFDPVALVRNIGYVRELVNHTFPVPRVGWHLGIDVIPGWVFQTREFWSLPLGMSGLKQLFLGVALPLLFAGLAILGAWRYRPARALLVFVAGCCLFAEYGFLSQSSCTYCAERDLLPLGPVITGLVAVGLWALVSTPRPWVRLLGVAGALLVVVAVGQRDRVELTRFINGSYFLDQSDRTLLTRLPAAPGRLLLEGYGESVTGQAELPLVYHLANELDPGQVTIPLGANDFNSLGYLTFGPDTSPWDPTLRPDYAYVLTRLGGVSTARQIVAKADGMALERRVEPLDVIPFSGIGVPPARSDPSGVAWVQPQLALRFYIAGTTPGAVWARLTFRSVVPVAVAPDPGVRSRARQGRLTVCVPAIGAPPIRRVVLRLSATIPPSPGPPGQFPPKPLEGLALSGMRAMAGSCNL